ncbi:hypothetical protein K438DRAFT_1805759 [Mycena galopus ATCC 62051]|nr:hypothetical protein K438DRAFT_1805759 [Mycena galopus ATCC 62051]
MPPRKKAGKAKQLVSAFPPSPHGFPALPLDILFEIFSLVHPLDLLYLTRTTKPFRRFLLNRANVGIWRAAFSVLRELDGGLPECPSYASEPAWARLVFERVCHICYAALRDSANVDPVWWEFNARYCGGCMTSHVTKSISQKIKRLDPKCDWKAVFPSVPRDHHQQDTCRYYLTAHQTELLDAYNKTEDAEARTAIIEKSVQDSIIIAQHSQLWRNWTRKKIQDRQTEATNREAEKRKKERDTTEARVDAIVAKLTALGWSNEPWMSHGTLTSQIRGYPSVVASKKLAPRAWRELEPALLSQLNADKQTYIVRNRLRVFLAAWPLIITPTEINNLALNIRPSQTDTMFIPAIREVLDKAGDAPVEKDQLVAMFRPLMPALLQKWAADTIVQIGEHAGTAFKLVAPKPSPDNSVLDPLSLAIAFVGCPRKCGAVGHIPALLKHHCDSNWLRTPVGTVPDADLSYWMAIKYCFFQQGKFTPAIFDFETHLDAVEGVVKAYERDPKTTTIADMAIERRLLCCVTCKTKFNDARGCVKPSVALEGMDWLKAMDHALKGHERFTDVLKINWELQSDTVA